MYLKRLKELRINKCFLQKDLAKLLNVAERTYSGYETGSRNIPNETLIDLAMIYNTSVDYILGISNVKKPYLK